MTANLIPEIDYTSKDFLSFKSMMRTYIERHPDYSTRITNFNESSLNNLLIELQSLIGDVLMFYLDRLANESILSTAKRRQSVIEILQLIDYHLSTALPSEGAANITIDPNHIDFPGYPATIPARYRISNGAQGDSEVFYETKTPLVFITGETVKSVDIFEGTTVYETGANRVGISDGTANQKFKLSTAEVIIPKDETEFGVVFELRVDGVLWHRVTDFVDSLSTDEEYVLTIDENDFVYVEFGNGNLGKIPTNGAMIECTYRVGGGVRGRLGANTLTKKISGLTWVDSVTNPDATTGGSNRESIDEAKRNGPKDLRTLRRAVSDTDHNDIAELTDGVAKAKTKPTAASLEIDVYIAPDGGGTPSVALINRVLARFEDTKIAPTVVRVFPASYQPADLDYELKITKGYKKSDISAAVAAALDALVAFDNVDFGTGVRLQEAYDSVKSILGIDSFLIKKFTLKPIFRAEDNNTGTPVFSAVTVRPTVRKREYVVTMTTNSDFEVTEREKGNSTTISGTQLQDTNRTFMLDEGTSTSVALQTLTDTTRVFEVNAFAGQTLIDSADNAFLIVSNDETSITLSAGTPTAGAYKVVRRLVGKYLNPNTKQNNSYVIVSNTENAIVVGVSISNLATAGDEYAIETLQTNTGSLGVLYEDDDSTLAFTITQGLIAVVIGDTWTFQTSEYVSDISTPDDVILEKGTFKATIFGGEI